MDRSLLLDVLKTVTGAVSSREDLPALSACYFDGVRARTSDGEVMISTPCELNIRGGVSHKTLLTFLSSCSSDKVEVQEGKKGGVRVVCGKSKLDLALLDLDKLIMQSVEDQDPPLVLPVPLDLLTAIEKASPTMGDDSSQPWRMGMTLAFGDGIVRVFSGRNDCMTLAVAPDESGSDSAVVLTARFVDILTSLGKSRALSGISIGTGWIEVAFEDETTLLSRTIGEVNVAGYEKPFSHLWGQVGVWMDIPEGLAEIAQRAHRMCSLSKESTTTLRIADGQLSLDSGDTGGLMGMTDTLPCGDKHEDITVGVIPKLLLEPLRHAKRMTVLSSAILFEGTDYQGGVVALKLKG